MMKFLKSKITRTVAFILSVVIVSFCAISICNAIKEFEEKDDKIGMAHYCSGEYYDAYEKLSSELWLIGNMYMKNLDKNGNLKGNEYYVKSVKENMIKSGLMTESGKLLLPQTTEFEYMVGFENKVYSNAGITEPDKNNIYAYYANANGAIYENYPVNMHLNNWCVYDNGQGMEYYYADEKGYAVFDYDTTGRESYVDELGATIYLNEDGTTPIPSNYVDIIESPDYYEEYYYGEDYSYSSGRFGYRTDVDTAVAYDANEYEYYVTEQEEYVSSLNYVEGYTVYITPNADIIAEYEETENQRLLLERNLTTQIIRISVPLIIAAVLMIFFFIISGYDNKTKSFRLNVLDKIWVEVYLVAIAVALIVPLAVIDAFVWRITEFKQPELNIIASLFLTTAYIVVCSGINTIIKRLKCKQLIRTSLIGKICIWIKNAILSIGKQKNNIALIRFAILTVAMLILGFIDTLFILESQSGVSEFMILVFFVHLALYIYFNYRNLKDIANLSRHIENISNGDYTTVTASNTSTVRKMTENLNSISDSIEKTVEKQVRSERMKIDLVTNVSHDLKTPLTSIISYVDLLAEEEMSEDARSYVTVLENKTQRLQTIVADLFDLAKATSRTDVNLESLDLTVLTRQVIGEMEDKLKASGRELRTDIAVEKAPVLADGKKLYRVLQNLLDNAMKYSLEGTRIYLKLYKENGKFVISIKNTASYEMTFTADEITERFVRGDKSRTGEGSGLGLSIAKSFSEACKGELEVKIEDDVFAVTVSFDEQE